MISICMAYYNRRELLLNTLESISNSVIKNIEIIIVDDNSTIEQDVFDLSDKYPFSIRVIKIRNKTHLNPCIPFNIAFNQAIGDIIVIQNPECEHNGDILKHVTENINDSNYITYACYSLSQNKSKEIRNVSAVSNGDSAWYNHSIYRPVAYHFCSAITKKNINELGGFDERYKNGIGYDDNELLLRIKRKGLNVSIVDNPFVYHQWHYSETINGPSNASLYEQTLRETRIKAND